MFNLIKSAIVVIGDGSINTIKKCKEINDSRIKIISNNNIGVSAVRNIGIKAEKGGHIFSSR